MGGGHGDHRHSAATRCSESAGGGGTEPGRFTLVFFDIAAPIASDTLQGIVRVSARRISSHVDRGLLPSGRRFQISAKLNRSETQIRTGGRVNCIGAGFGIGFATAAPISKTPLSPGRRSLLACLFREITCQERELPVYVCQMARRTWRMRPVLLWALGIPIPVIILLYLFHVI
jgi:hypothetical protein